jgi:DNA/RNA endonuclease YhcR with UshA esterase domain
MARLEQRLGQEVTVLGSVSNVVYRDRGPAVVKLARSRTSSFDIVFFDHDVLLATGVQFKVGEYVQVRGVVQKYRSPRGIDQLQLQVTLPGQVLAPSESLEQLLSAPPRAGNADKDDGE